MTCDYRSDCQYVSASFSQSGQYFILECLGPGVPTFHLRSTQDNRGTCVTVPFYWRVITIRPVEEYDGSAFGYVCVSVCLLFCLSVHARIPPIDLICLLKWRGPPLRCSGS